MMQLTEIWTLEVGRPSVHIVLRVIMTRKRTLIQIDRIDTIE